MIVAIIICVSIVVLDQVSKFFLYGIRMSLIGDFLWLEPAFNKGAAFGMLQDGTLFFIIVTAPMMIGMVYLIFSKRFNISTFGKISIGVLLGGTIGNFIDRIFLGGVRDFIYFKSIDFAIFNVADIAITVGVILLAIYLLIGIIKDSRKEKILEIKKENNQEEN